MRKLLTSEVNAAVRTVMNSEADAVYVNNSHGSGYNIIFEELDSAAEIIYGRGGRASFWIPCLDESFDAVIAIGQHAMAGTRDANLPHWYINNNRYLLSEVFICAALAGYFDVPEEDVKGGNFFQMVLEALNKLSWNKYGLQELDDYGYPDKIDHG